MENIYLKIKSDQTKYFSNLPDTKRDYYLGKLENIYSYQKTSKQSLILLLKGLRGVGKTVLSKQFLLNIDSKKIYIKFDENLLKYNQWDKIIEYFYNDGCRVFVLDEINFLSNWQILLKNIFDKYSDVFILATGSGFSFPNKNFLARRHIEFNLPTLSFREYLNIRYKLNLKTIALEDFFDTNIVIKLLDKVPNLFLKWQEYLKYGGFAWGDDNEIYYNLLYQNIRKIVLEDISLEYNFKSVTLRKILKLLEFLGALDRQDKITYETIVDNTGLDRKEILHILDILGEYNLINIVKVESKSTNLSSRTQYKIFLFTGDFYYMFAQMLGKQVSIGIVRESIFVSMIASLYKITFPKGGKQNPDFIVETKQDKYLFEIGGKSKNISQIKKIKGFDHKNIVKDVELDKIPLWLFGFLS